MRDDIAASYVTAMAQADDQKFAALLEIHADTVLYRARWASDITFDSNTYTADKFDFGEFRQSADLDTPSLDLRIQNIRHPSTDAELPWSSYLQTTDLNGVEVRVRIVNLALLADSTAQVAEVAWYISGWRLNRREVTFQLTSPHNSNVYQFPGPPLGSDRCWWQALGLYKLHPCNSVSALKTCPGTIAACADRFPEVALRFGPSYPFAGIQT